MEILKNEIWKDIPGYEGIYKISSEGRIKSIERLVERSDNIETKINEKILNQYTIQGGYKRVWLYKSGTRKGVLVHRLVAESFLHNPKNKDFVNHLDGNPSNNSRLNLEWCTASENIRHSIDELDRKIGLVGGNSTKKKSILCTLTESNLNWIFISIREASRVLNIPSGSICNVLKRRRKSCYGYTFKYN